MGYVSLLSFILYIQRHYSNKIFHTVGRDRSLIEIFDSIILLHLLSFAVLCLFLHSVPNIIYQRTYYFIHHKVTLSYSLMLFNVFIHWWNFWMEFGTQGWWRRLVYWKFRLILQTYFLIVFRRVFDQSVG
jgi:hypothetical protein